MVNRASRLLTISRILLALSALWLPEKTFGVGHWTSVATNVADNLGLIMLLSDGTVLAEGSNSNWWKLTPDSTGHYVNGALTPRQSSNWGHQTGSSAVLTNGNVYVAGGENGNGSSKVEIYNPVTGLWSVAINPTYFGSIQDGNAMVMPDGRVLVEPQGESEEYSGDTFLFNPGNNTFSQTTNAPLMGLGEASWVKLPNDNVLVIDSGGCGGSTNAYMYIPSAEIWTNAVTGGTLPNIWPNMCGTCNSNGCIVSEEGPAFLLPNGNAIFFGGAGLTAVYSNGIWSQSASLPGTLGQKDAPGAMLVNGRVLLAVSPQGDNSSASDANGIGPTSFYEYTYTANNGAGAFTNAPNPASLSGAAAACNLLDLPDGTVLLSVQTGQLYVYQPDGSPLAAGQPTIYSVQWNANGSLHLTGTLFNGISQGAAFGDDAQMDSNWPLVRFTSGSTVLYGYTYNWSSTSVQTGGRIVTTEVTVPPAVLNFPGQWSLQVVANGIASAGVTFYSPVWVNFSYYSAQGYYFGFSNYPYSTLADGVANVRSGGTIAIESSSTVSDEALTITNAMNIISVGGPSTVGN